jgi:predicted TIM-barrel enzyme
MNISAAKASIGKEQGNAELCRKVLEYAEIFNSVVHKAKQPGFSVADWAALAELVAVDEFVRVGHMMEVMNWHEYTAFVTRFATSLSWEGTFRRVQERSGVVYLELIERCTIGARVDVANTMTVYEFNAAGKLCHLDVYLQQKPVQAA